MPANHESARFVLVGVPANRRVAMFQEALGSSGLPPAIVISWLDIATRRVRWDQVLAPNMVLRLESSGEDFETERAILAVGADEEDEEDSAARISRSQALALDPDFGAVRYLRQWFLGFSRLLRELTEALPAVPSLALMQTPGGIELLFDKVRFQAILADAGHPVPRSLGRVRSFDQLISEMDRAATNRVFVKPAHGSSASGVMALERSGGRIQAFSPTELVRQGGSVRIYNSLKVRKYTNLDDIAALVNALAPERVQVESWVPKAGLDEHRIDVRVLVVGGKARHAVVRQSRSPMTNLHLGNARGDLERLVERMGQPAWDALCRRCEQAQPLCGGNLYAGWDVAIGTDFRKHWLLEANAFGDLLPRVLHEGKTTYQAEIAAVLSSSGQATRGGLSQCRI